jgi:hypothetical protein
LFFINPQLRVFEDGEWGFGGEGKEAFCKKLLPLSPEKKNTYS